MKLNLGELDNSALHRR
jgi:hypothetical protein